MVKFLPAVPSLAGPSSWMEMVFQKVYNSPRPEDMVLLQNPKDLPVVWFLLSVWTPWLVQPLPNWLFPVASCSLGPPLEPFPALGSTQRTRLFLSPSVWAGAVVLALEYAPPTIQEAHNIALSSFRWGAPCHQWPSTFEGVSQYAPNQ